MTKHRHVPAHHLLPATGRGSVGCSSAIGTERTLYLNAALCPQTLFRGVWAGDGALTPPPVPRAAVAPPHLHELQERPHVPLGSVALSKAVRLCGDSAAVWDKLPVRQIEGDVSLMFFNDRLPADSPSGTIQSV